MIELRVTNTGAEELPIGIGLHPWFACDESTRLHFSASQQVMSDVAGLPIHIGPVLDDFAEPRTLPARRIDNTFIGWDGTAWLRHRNGTVKLQSSAPMLHIFSPHASAGFCCVEPTTSVPNAPNVASGTRLGVGEVTSIEVAACWEEAES